MLEDNFFTELSKLYLEKKSQIWKLHPCSQTSGTDEIPFYFLHDQNFIILWFFYNPLNYDSSFCWEVKLILSIRNDSVDIKLIDRVSCLEQEFCLCTTPLEWMEHLLVLCFKIPRINALVLLKTGCSIFLKRCFRCNSTVLFDYLDENFMT